MKQLIKRLTELVGSNRIIINTAHHVQVTDNNGGKHDIWFSHKNGYKYKLSGNRKVISVSNANSVYSAIEKWCYTKTDKSTLERIVSLSNFIDRAISNKFNPAIFTDAGFKDGIAKIAAIMIIDDNIDIKSRVINVENINEAEVKAIDLGISMRTDDSIIVYNDNKTACFKFDNNVEWLPRRNNHADKFGNMRG